MAFESNIAMSARSISALVLLTALPAFGQSVTVQQPVVESFSVGTSVSVPDRGRIGLGGVSRAANGRRIFGPLPGPRTSGQSRSASSMSVGVTIHDLEAMDAAVLNAAAGTAPRPAYTKNRYSDATSYAMSRRFGALAKGGERRGAAGKADELGGLTPAARREALGDALRFLSLGEEAERRGRPGVAAIHYRVAAKAGSTEAKRRLAELAETASAPAAKDPQPSPLDARPSPLTPRHAAAGPRPR